MINPSAKSTTQVQLLPSANAANTAQATGGWVDCRTAVGDIMVVLSTGAITGNMTPTFETAPFANGTGNVAVLPAGGNLALVSAANNIQKTWLDSSQNLGWLKFIGTVATGPIVIGVSAHFHNKYSG